MERRNFIRGAAAGSGAALALGPVAALAQSPGAQWRLQTSYASSAGDVLKLYEDFGTRIATITGDKFKVRVLPQAGAEANDLISQVSKGSIEAALTVAGEHVALDKAFAFVSGLPFGMNARLHHAWYQLGGGREVLQELFDKHKVEHIRGGGTGVRMTGFFKKEIKSLTDLKGLNIQASGIDAELLAQLGAAPQQPGSDIAAALKSGSLDAAQAGSPVTDEKLGLHKEARFYYTLGFGDYNDQNSFFVNKAKWAQLPEAHREAFARSAAHLNEQHLAYFDANNIEALTRMNKDGAQLRAMPRDVLARAYEAAFDLYETEAKRDPLFKKIYTQWSRFREDSYRWNSFNEFPLDQYVIARIGKRRKT